ncbi:MAG TPA: YSC84-related protein [Terriglobales bacterium]|nr:YSC84-related protein [Terriglobales bacterium]
MKGKIFLFFVMFLIVCGIASVACAALQEDVDQAVSIIERFEEIPESAIPPAVMRDAKGLAILTVTKAGFIVSGRGGTGIVIARTDSGWSGPSAIGTGGLGVGFQAGMQVSEYVIVLNTQEAVNAFAKGGNVTLGANLSAALGPIGRSAEAGVAPQAALYTYSRSQGIFAGVSLEGTVIGTRYEANEEFYGKPVYPSDILSGKEKPPAGAQKLLDVLAKYPGPNTAKNDTPSDTR